MGVVTRSATKTPNPTDIGRASPAEETARHGVGGGLQARGKERRLRGTGAHGDGHADPPAEATSPQAEGSEGAAQGRPRLTSTPMGGVPLERREAIAMTTAEEGGGLPTTFLKEALLELQQRDEFITTKAYELATGRCTSGREGELWKTGTDGLLWRRGMIYVPNAPAMRAELLATHHDDPYAGHFRFAREHKSSSSTTTTGQE